MFRKISAFSIILIVSVFLGCPHPTEITPMPPTVTDQDQCTPACVHLRELNCDEGKPIDMKKSCYTDHDCDSHQDCLFGRCTVPCEDFCRATENEGVFLDPTCVVKITSCDQIDSCPASVIKK